MDYSECTWDGDSSGGAWCSTSVDITGTHVGGNWGNCGPNCPIPPDPKQSPGAVEGIVITPVFNEVKGRKGNQHSQTIRGRSLKLNFCTLY